MKKRMAYIALLVTVIFVTEQGCKKETEVIVPEEILNPFDTIDYGQDPTQIPVDSASFLGLHNYIFSTSCAVPACHDGAFEPDFRTVESSYSTLVYHPVLKNNANGDFTYRVTPGDKNLSWLHERITTDDAVLGRMPLYDTLSAREIELITNWIEDGAKDVLGNSPVLPNLQPTFFGILAYENDTTGVRHDTNRANIVAPMQLPANTNIDMWVGLYDIDNNGDFIPGNGFTHNKYNISDHLFEYSQANEKDLIVENALEPFMGPIPFAQGQLAPYYHHFKINTADYTVGKTYYFRVYVKDDNHTNPTELPEDGSQIYLLTYFSFIVQ